eukprot:311756-Chlamydomonas_euryale.AAC.1
MGRADSALAPLLPSHIHIAPHPPAAARPGARARAPSTPSLTHPPTPTCRSSSRRSGTRARSLAAFPHTSPHTHQPQLVQALEHARSLPGRLPQQQPQRRHKCRLLPGRREHGPGAHRAQAAVGQQDVCAVPRHPLGLPRGGGAGSGRQLAGMDLCRAAAPTRPAVLCHGSGAERGNEMQWAGKQGEIEGKQGERVAIKKRGVEGKHGEIKGK